jgi:hypothetical protein
MKEHEIRFSEGRIEGGRLVESNVRMIKQSDIGKCPFVILMPEHYREDGSCMCDDAAERARMQKEWGYRAKDFKNIPLRKV